MTKKRSAFISSFNQLHAGHKLLLSFLAALSSGFFTAQLHTPVLTRIMIGWVVFCFVMLLLNWVTFFTISSGEIRNQSKEQDESRLVIFSIILICTLAGFAAVILLITSKAHGGMARELELGIGFSAMLCSWLLAHTIFAFRYAHLYYGNDKLDKEKPAGGLEFPDEPHPDYLDFAYFSFVVGMTFQVSDVVIKHKRLRRLVLMHSLISFLFNTIVVALTINVIAGLGNS